MKQSFILILTLISLLTGCAHTSRSAVDVSSLDGLLALSSEDMAALPDKAAENRGLRFRALGDTAMSLGAQGGLAWASKEINARLQKDRWYLETIYNFNGMVLSHGVLPPVLVEGNNTLNLANSQTLRISDKTYSIIQQARFATTVPNWREYLWLPYRHPDMPDKILMPRNAGEQKVWRDNINRGWQKGIEQAYSIFRQNLARLKRDYHGMILYRKLLQEKMVSAPFVSRTELGVTGDGSDMHVNDQVLRITVLPKLQINPKHWKAIVVPSGD